MHSADNGFILVRTRDGQNAGMGGANGIGLNPIATSDNHPAVLFHCFANGSEAFSLGTIEKATRVDQHHVGISVTGCDQITLSAKLGENTLGIHECLGATERNETDFRDVCVHGGGV